MIWIIIASVLSFASGCWFTFHALSERVSKDIKGFQEKLMAEHQARLLAVQDGCLRMGQAVARPCRQNVIDVFAKGVPQTPRAEYLLLQIEHQLESLNVFAKHGPALGDTAIAEFDWHSGMIKSLSDELERLKTA